MRGHGARATARQIFIDNKAQLQVPDIAYHTPFNRCARHLGSKFQDYFSIVAETAHRVEVGRLALGPFRKAMRATKIRVTDHAFHLVDSLVTSTMIYNAHVIEYTRDNIYKGCSAIQARA